MIFFHQGTEEQGAAFLDRFWPGARAVSDPECRFFGSFGLARGSLGELLGPAVWGAAIRAALRGNFVGRPVGDPTVMPGIFLVEADRVLWRHDYEQIGQRPDLREAARVATAQGGAGA